MQAGKLRHVLTIERVKQVQGPGNKLVDQWLPVYVRIRGEVLPDRAQEFFGAREVQATTNAVIRIRQLNDIVPTMRVVHHVAAGVDEYWSIEGVVPFQSRLREIRLMCLKRDAEGWRRGTDVRN